MASASHINNTISPIFLTEYKDLLSVNDLSQIFEVSKNTVYRSIKDGKFGTPIQIGRAYKIPKNFVIKKFFHNYS